MEKVVFDAIPHITNTDFSIQVSWNDGYDTTVRLYSNDGFMLEGVILGCCHNNVLMVTHAYGDVTEEERNKDIIDTIDATGSVTNLWDKPRWVFHRTVKYDGKDIIAFNRHEFILDEE